MNNHTQVWLALLVTFLAGISTGIGGLIPLFIKDLKKKYLHFSLGLSAGVMIYISFAELLKSSVENIGFFTANIAFFSGIISIMIIDFIVPHEYIEEHTKMNMKEQKLMSAGVFTALGIAIHNFPEGVAVFVSCLGNIRVGISVAFAVVVHNIPEGIAVAIPIYYATKSKKKAFWYSLLSGIVEPVGAIIAMLILLPFLTPKILYFSFAFVAGIMVFISFDELLPLSYEDEENHISVLGIITGMLIMAISLYIL
ncbi:MAG: zinc transporter ZupT [Elusimicrobiota bacterium]